MKKIVKAIACFAAFGLVSACSSNDVVIAEPQPYSSIVMSNSEGVSYEYNEEVSLSTVGERASIHCASEGKKAVLINNITPKNGPRVAAFDCR